MSDFGVTFSEDDGKELRPEGLVKLRVRSTGYKADQPCPQIVDTKSGKALKVYYDIVEGQYKGCIVEEFINFQNQSAQAQNIGRATLGKLAKAVGLSGLEEFNQVGSKALKGKVFMANVITTDDEYKGNIYTKTKVKSYIAKDASTTDNTPASEVLDDEIPVDFG
jgi:hypothetical protein